MLWASWPIDSPLHRACMFSLRLADLAMLEGHLDDDLDPVAKAKIAAAESRIHLADDLNPQARTHARTHARSPVLGSWLSALV